MDSNLIGGLDSLARVIGWIAIVVFAIYMLGVVIRRYFADKDAESELEAMSKFQPYLAESNPQKWERYLEIRHEYHMRREYPDWRVLAGDAGVPDEEIYKNRSC